MPSVYLVEFYEYYDGGLIKIHQEPISLFTQLPLIDKRVNELAKQYDCDPDKMLVRLAGWL